MTVCRQCQQPYEGDPPSFCGRCGADLRRAGARSEIDSDEAEVALSDPWLGRVIGGRYRVLERLGGGGMGVVYKVEHTAMGKLAALKMLHPTLSSEREVAKRFRTEARAVSLLTHPNTVQVFDFGEHEGNLFMVMELVRGTTLASLVDRDGPMPWRRLAPLLVQVCEALAEAHEAGIVHRDIKPENLLVVRTREGRETVKVVDFGLAKLREHSELATTTGRNKVIGTPYFMSPEQIRGDALDARTDIYSLGATAYDVLTGEHAFDGPTPLQVLTAHLTEPVVPPSRRRPDAGIERRVDAVILRAMARNPEERIASADMLRAAIEALDDSEPVSVRRSPTPEPVPSLRLSQVMAPPQLSREDFDRFERALRRRRWMGAGIGVAVLAGAAGAGAWALLRGDAARPVVEEIEPNNEPAQANPIAENQPVRGQIGKRLSLETSDRDFYLFRVADGPVAAHIDASGVPRMELHLAVFDRFGDKIGETDSGGAGDPEVIPNLRLERGDYWAEVREEWVAGGMATENLTDWYSLKVTWHPLGPDEEAEPDDTPATALPVPLGRPYVGYLGREGDVDFYYPRGDAGGVLDGRVSGVPGVDVKVVALPSGTQVTGDPASAPGAKVFDAAGTGGAEDFLGLPWPRSGGAPLIVVMRKDRQRAGGQPHEGAPGLDVPYTLMVRRRGSR
jgi:serine/threonine-protein kinase